MFFWGLLKPHNIDSLNNSTMSFVAVTMLAYIIGAELLQLLAHNPYKIKALVCRILKAKAY